MKLTKYRFIAIGALMLVACFLGQTVYAAERIVQLTIPGCASWGLSQRIGSILKTTAGVIKHEITQENTINITFDDENISVDGILATLQKGALTVTGTPVLIK